MPTSGLVRTTVIGGTLLLSLVLAAFLWRPEWLFHWNDFRTGNKIVRRVEAFRTGDNGTLPETLQQVGIGDADLNVYYQRVDEHAYTVWFGTTLGESETL